jgi:chromosomal replication initiation ATPase DnaA
MRLNPMYTFDRYVPSSPRACAVRACRALSNGGLAGKRCLCLFGPPGTGKTHLLHAIGHAAKQRDASTRVTVVPVADVVTDLVENLRRGRVPAPSEPIAQAHVLLLDNLEVLVDRPATQAEVARLVTARLADGAAVACAAACPPSALRGLTLAIPPPEPKNIRLAPLSQAHLRRILWCEARGWGLVPPKRIIDRIARRSSGDARRTLGQLAAWRLEQKLSAVGLAHAGVGASVVVL